MQLISHSATRILQEGCVWTTLDCVFYWAINWTFWVQLYLLCRQTRIRLYGGCDHCLDAFEDIEHLESSRHSNHLIYYNPPTFWTQGQTTWTIWEAKLAWPRTRSLNALSWKRPRLLVLPSSVNTVTHLYYQVGSSALWTGYWNQRKSWAFRCLSILWCGNYRRPGARRYRGGREFVSNT